MFNNNTVYVLGEDILLISVYWMCSFKSVEHQARVVGKRATSGEFLISENNFSLMMSSLMKVKIAVHDFHVYWTHKLFSRNSRILAREKNSQLWHSESVFGEFFPEEKNSQFQLSFIVEFLLEGENSHLRIFRNCRTCLRSSNSTFFRFSFGEHLEVIWMIWTNSWNTEKWFQAISFVKMNFYKYWRTLTYVMSCGSIIKCAARKSNIGFKHHFLR